MTSSSLPPSLALCLGKHKSQRHRMAGETIEHKSRNCWMRRIHCRLKWKSVLSLLIFSIVLMILSLSMIVLTSNSADRYISKANPSIAVESTAKTGAKPDGTMPIPSDSSKAESIISASTGIWLDHEQTGEGNDTSSAASQRAQIDPAILANLLPHLRQRQFRHLSNLNARVLLNAPNLLRSPPELLLMIPTIRRQGQNYLLETLQNLIKNMAEEEKHFVQIVVVISENQWSAVGEQRMAETMAEIGNKFAQQVHEGLIEVIAPPKEWFPPGLEHVPPTLGDSPERMLWRTKQNLDYAWAMMHVHVERPLARFYVQLEDDIITVPNFISELHRMANSHANFFFIEFSNLGFIGRMFHNNEDLAHMANFILLLHKAQPVDWVLTHVLSSKFCSQDETWKKCLDKRINNLVVFRRLPALFQHVGKQSSLRGKVQNLTEKNFGKNGKITMETSGNPPAGQFSTSHQANGTNRLRALYERFVPFTLELGQQQEDNWLCMDYSAKPLARLKALRLFYSVHLDSNISSLTPPPSPFHIHIGHSQGEIISDDFPPEASQQGYLLLIPKVPLNQVRTIRINVAPGDWQARVQALKLTAIRVVA